MGLVKRTYVDGETVITADNLNDIQDEIIQNASDISTKGTYSKPSGGIPSTDLASAVQTSLGKADTALQSSDIDNTLTVSGKAADAKKTGDEISDVKNTLSHKADVIYDTASGDIASFPDGADGLPVKDLTVSIEPVQSGTGDPSPTNVRPISGWTGANVSRTGVNVWDEETKEGYYSATDGTFNVSAGQLCSKNQIPVKPSTKYWYYKNTSLGDVLYYGIDGSYLGSNINIYTNREFTTPANCYFIQINIGSNYGGTYNHDVSINYPSTDTTYHAYTGTTIPISWQSEAGTVYAGYVDPVTGEMVVDRLMYTSLVRGFSYDSTAKWWSNGRLEYVNNKWLENNKQLCNLAPFKSYGELAQNTSLIGFFISKNGDVIIRTGDSENAPTGYQFCVPIAVPQTYQLDPVTVTTLLGQNNVWSDTGAVLNCEYPCDTKLYIDKKLAALVAALS